MKDTTKFVPLSFHEKLSALAGRVGQREESASGGLGWSGYVSYQGRKEPCLREEEP